MRRKLQAGGEKSRGGGKPKGNGQGDQGLKYHRRQSKKPNEEETASR